VFGLGPAARRRVFGCPALTFDRVARESPRGDVEQQRLGRPEDRR